MTNTGRIAPAAPVRRDERGIALLVVVMVVALITIVASDLAYRSKIDLMAAQNFKDELRAHYLLRSSADLSRLLFKIQRSVIDKIKGIDLQAPHYAPYLIGAFADKGQAEGLGSLLGVDAAATKGLGIDGGTIEAEIAAEDGKVNLNCAGSIANSKARDTVAAELLALLSPAQFNPLFERPDAEGEHHDRAEIVQALIDWADPDELRYGADGPEDYGYEAERDPYRSRNNPYDTPGEIRMVRGIDDDFVRLFGDALTIWGGGSCKINVNEAPPLVLWSLIVENAKNREEFQNLARAWEALDLAVYLYEMRTLFGFGFATIADVIKAVEQPEDTFALPPDIPGLPALRPAPPGVPLDHKKFNAAALAGKRRVWRLKASAEVGRVHRKLDAVWDMDAPSQVTQSQGTWVYWREE